MEALPIRTGHMESGTNSGVMYFSKHYKSFAAHTAILISLSAAVQAVAQTSITIYPNFSPVRLSGTDLSSPFVVQYRLNVMTGLTTGQPNVGGDQSNDPSAFNTIGQPITNSEGNLEIGIFDMVGLPFNFWRGKQYASGPFANEYGTFLRTSLHIESNTPFTSDDVKVGLSEDFYQDEFTLSSLLTSGLYSATSWGDDHQRGTPDDVSYGADPLPPDALVNEINATGPGWMFYYLPDPAVTPQDTINEYQQFINTDYNGRYEGKVYITLQDTTSAVNIAASVPDSGPIGIVAAGALLGLIRFSNRRKS